ncbi:MAG: hypothetical protein HDQ88_04900 [Clostridia bacterium]|nr:hypothetical protein [Clostridia bacterium]
MRKFKIGDKVRITEKIRDCKSTSQDMLDYIGEIRTVTDIAYGGDFISLDIPYNTFIWDCKGLELIAHTYLLHCVKPRLTENEPNTHTRAIMTLDHPITPNDITNFENDYNKLVVGFSKFE